MSKVRVLLNATGRGKISSRTGQKYREHGWQPTDRRKVPMVQIHPGCCAKSDGANKTCARLCVACSSPPLTSHWCVASILGPPRATLCGSIFSNMGVYSKEQGHCLSLHWEISAPCSSIRLPHSLQKQGPFSLLTACPMPFPHWTISPILHINNWGLILFFLIICTTAASEHCSLRAKIYS